MMVGLPPLQQAIALSRAGRNAEALAIIQRLVAQKDPAATALLAEMTWRGGMVPQDPAAGRALFERASGLGHPGAAHIVTNLLGSGIAGRRDWAEARARLRLEARQDPRRRRAHELLAAMRLDAEGDPLDLPEGEPLSQAPEVTLYRGLLEPRECAYLLALAEPRYAASFVNDAQGREVRDTIRTSDGAPLHWMIEDPALHALNRRMAAVSGTRYDQAEATQILRYQPGQEYKPHYDFVRAAPNQRMLTLLIWLNDDYDGGETRFLETGLDVKGKTGDAVVFRNMASDRSLDKMTRHAGMPVTRGTKFIVSKWIRESRWTP